ACFRRSRVGPTVCQDGAVEVAERSNRASISIDAELLYALEAHDFSAAESRIFSGGKILEFLFEIAIMLWSILSC
ncbi:hypothetical protein QM646_26465, partial [Rhodococcus erythropolis]|nr:hypothetical protein [Rhodococcus erythropolis]